MARSLATASGPARGVIRALGLLLLSASSAAAQVPATSTDAKTVVATVGSVSITLGEADAIAMKQSATRFGEVKLAQALFEARRVAVGELVDRELLEREAKARGIDRTALIAQEITSKVAPVSEADIQTWYQANPARVQGATLEQVREPIRSLLVQERTAQAHTTFVDRLKARTTVRILLDPPRLMLDSAGKPAKGPAGAPIELVEFTDFECPYCQRAEPILQRVFEAYGERIRFVYRAFPLPIHPNARSAAEAAACAADQNKFWTYHDRLFTNQSKLSDADLKQHAAELGADPARFNKCLDARAHNADVDADIRAGSDAGVTGTPSFFVNGRLISGVAPFEQFKQIIDEELERQRKH